jgi:D-glycero-alpha-D-manno-heptose 1-phosphate guanylyltransferase
MPCADLLVLAGGFGTRLRSAVPELPKPLAPIVGKPFLHYQIENWVGQGVRRITFLLHHQAALIEHFLETLRGTPAIAGCELRTLTEAVPLGTGGAVSFAVRTLGLSQPFLVTNADTWLGSGIVRAQEAAAPALAVIHVEDSGRYGAVRVANNQRVEAFEEKCANASAGWINAGLYHLPAQLFQDWNGESYSLERELFPGLAKAGNLSAAPLATEFIDIGIPADYFRFGRWIEAGKVGLP